MPDVVHIPLFPLSILPLPGELVPLHIFEPRYRQLLQDAEVNDIRFGIYFTHEINTLKVGSIVKLESVIKRYPGGEADIIVKCEDLFSLDLLLRTFRNKLYPGGDVRFWKVDQSIFPGAEMYDLFFEYLKFRNINKHVSIFNLYEVANELSLDLADRYKMVTTPDDKKEQFLSTRIKFQLHILKQEAKSRDTFYLN